MRRDDTTSANPSADVCPQPPYPLPSAGVAGAPAAVSGTAQGSAAAAALPAGGRVSC